MRKPSANQLAERLELENRAHLAHAIALNALLHRPECVTEPIKCDDYTLRVADPCANHGGIALWTFHPHDNPQQRPYTTAYYWEQWADETARYCWNADTGAARELAELIERKRAIVRDIQRKEAA